MRRTGKTIDTAMFAAAIGIDRPVEGDVGTVIAGKDAARLFDLHLRLEGVEAFQRLPAVIGDFALLLLEAAGGIDARATSSAAIDIDPQTALVHQAFGNLCRIGRRKSSLP